MWTLEVFMARMGDGGMWCPMFTGSEGDCRERYDWHIENQTGAKINLRNMDEQPDPPAVPEAVDNQDGN